MHNIQQSDPGGLVMVHIAHNMLEEALILAVEYIDAAALGRGAEYFGIVRVHI